MRLVLLCTIGLLTTAAATRPGIPAPPADVARPLPFFYDFYTFRGERGGTDIVAAFAVPAGRLETEKQAGRVRYRFDVSLVLNDTARHSLSRTDDSVYVELTRPLSGDHLLYTHLEVRARPSRTTVQRVIMSDATTPGIGQLYHASHAIPDYAGSRLMLSDIALGQPDALVGWERGEVTLALLPTSHFPAGTFEVYYEVYNLPAGNAYTTEIVVEHLDARVDDARRSLRFDGEAAPDVHGRLQELRRVQTTLERGAYRLTVIVTDRATGASARGSRVFEVRGREGSATMVPALPRTTAAR